jgi:hypothetical protein
MGRILKFWNDWYDIYGTTLPLPSNNNDVVNNDHNSGYQYILNVFIKSGGKAKVYNVPLRSVIDRPLELQPYWMRAGTLINQNISSSLGFSFPTDLVSQAMPSVTTQFNPNPPAPRRMIISPDMERDHLYRSSSALYYSNLENSKKWTIEVLKAKILNHRCSKFGDSTTTGNFAICE